MAIRIIRKGQDPVLRAVAKPVPAVTPVIEKLLDDMAETMYDAEGVGLAAPQIGISKRVIVMDVGEGLIELINPEIVEKRGSETDYEACLSLPGVQGEVVRARQVTVQGINRQGEPITLKAKDYLARCVQHEVDHLDGILFTDYVDPEKLYYVKDDVKEKELSQQ